jgi:hypothetical protein
MSLIKIGVKKDPAREFVYRGRGAKRAREVQEEHPDETGAWKGKEPEESEEPVLSQKRQKTAAIEKSLPELQEWDPRSLPNGFFVVVEGKRRTGKSTFIKWLLQWYQDRFALVWVMTQTAASGFWQEFVGNAFVFDGYRGDALAKLIARNDKIIAKHGEESAATLKAASTLVIFDDCITRDILYDEIFTRLAVEGRHHCINVIFSTQDPKTVTPKVRDNCDVAVVFNQKTFRNKESIWHDFMNDVDKDTAHALMSKHAIEHNALVCVQTNLDGVITKNFFVSTGDKTKLQDPHYMLGGPEQRKIIRKEREDAKAKKARDREQKRAASGESSYSVEKILKGEQ